MSSHWLHCGVTAVVLNERQKEKKIDTSPADLRTAYGRYDVGCSDTFPIIGPSDTWSLIDSVSRLVWLGDLLVSDYSRF